MNGFPQTPSMYINIRQPLRLELFEQYKAKIKKLETQSSDKESEKVKRAIKFGSDSGKY
tara:strand:+ start:11976 stop:12152 length:177 start_codon:yes stop_codon:yes gene_type:complete